MSGSGLPDYIEVKDRVKAFYERYPEGSLQGSHSLEQIGDQTFLIFRAEAYRTPTDERPGVGHAWEPVPGVTQFTKNSELMVGETSAWGRAIAALGFEVNRSIASADEVRNRQDGPQGRMREGGPPLPSAKQLDLIERLAKKLGADSNDQLLIRSYSASELSGGRDGTASKVIDRLQAEGAADTLVAMVSAANDWQSHQSDVPADVEGLRQQPALDESGMPWEPARA